MKPQILLVWGILAVLAVSGCSQLSSIGATNIQEILSNQSNFVNKEITIKGILNQNFLPLAFERQAIGYDNPYSIQDAQGYSFTIKPYPEVRELFAGKTYSVKGYVRAVECCVCEKKRDYADGTTYGWEPDFMGMVSTLKSDSRQIVTVCERPPENFGMTVGGNLIISYRCQPNSKSYFYYLEASEPMTLLN